MPNTRLLLISRDDILAATGTDEGDKAFRLMAALTRQGYHLLATAPQPETWKGEHGSPDDALLGPSSIRRRISDAGGTLDGVYYVRRSLLTQKRNRMAALQDILDRYKARADHTILLSSSKEFVKAAKRLGLQATYLTSDTQLVEELADLNARPAGEATS